MASGPFLRAIQRVADSLRRLLPQQRAIMFASPLTVENVDESAAQGTLLGPGGSSEISGYHKVGLNLGGAGVVVRIPLVLLKTSTQTSSSSDGTLGAAFLQLSDYMTGCTSAILYGAVERVDAPSRVHLELYNETEDASIISGNTTDSPGEILLDVGAALIGAPKAFYSIRGWSADAGTMVGSLVELRLK